MSRTITVDYHGLPEYLQKDAIKQAKEAYPPTSFTGVLQRKVHFCLSCPEDTDKERRRIVGLTFSPTPIAQ